eukprot:358476-Chlamydomonas_euryale.AAC.2
MTTDASTGGGPDRYACSASAEPSTSSRSRISAKYTATKQYRKLGPDVNTWSHTCGRQAVREAGRQTSRQ